MPESYPDFWNFSRPKSQLEIWKFLVKVYSMIKLETKTETELISVFDHWARPWGMNNSTPYGQCRRTVSPCENWFIESNLLPLKSYRAIPIDFFQFHWILNLWKKSILDLIQYLPRDEAPFQWYRKLLTLPKAFSRRTKPSTIEIFNHHRIFNCCLE